MLKTAFNIIQSINQFKMCKELTKYTFIEVSYIPLLCGSENKGLFDLRIKLILFLSFMKFLISKINHRSQRMWSMGQSKKIKLTHSLIYPLETVPNSKKLQRTTEMCLSKDSKKRVHRKHCGKWLTCSF